MLVVRVFAPFALGYFLVSIFRSINSVIAPALMRDLDLNATGLGFAVSAFFLGATIMQLPYGLLLDRYDPRRVYAFFLLLCALGATVVSMAEDIILLAIGRALVALGTAASAVTTFKVFAMWFKPERLALANGLSLAAGGLGLMAGTAPVEAALQVMDWRDIHLMVGAVLACCAVLVWCLVPGKHTKQTGLTLAGQIKGLGVIARSPEYWRAAPLMMAVLGSYAAMTQLWAGPWVRDVAGFSGTSAANLLLVLAGAMTLAGLLTGPLVAWAGRLGLTPMGFVVAMVGLFVLVLIALVLEWTPTPFVVFSMWALFGFLATLNFATYAALAPCFAPELTGRLNACLTLAWMLGAFFVQNAYGIVLDWFQTPGQETLIEGHRVGVAMMAAMVLAALGWYWASSRAASRRSINTMPVSAPRAI